MSLTEYFRILRRWGWLLVLATVLTAGAAYVFSKVQTPIYRSTVVVNIQPARPDFGLTSSAKILLRSYVTVIDTETYAQRVINTLHLDRGAGDLLSNVTIASDDSRLVIQIDVRDPVSSEAYDIAAAWAAELVTWRDEQNAQVNISDKVSAVIVDPPSQPALYRPTTKINVLAGAILGLILGGLIVFVVEYLDAGVIRSSNDLDRLQLAVLGAIPAEAALVGRGARAG